MTTADFLVGARRGEVREAFPGEHVELAPPPDAGRRFSRIPGWYPSDRWRLEHDLAPELALRLERGVVFGNEGWIGPDEGRVLADWNTYWRTDAEIARAVDAAVAEGVVALEGTTASLLQARIEQLLPLDDPGAPTVVRVGRHVR